MGIRSSKEEKGFVEEINEIISSIHKKLTGGSEEILVIYEPSNGNISLEDAIRKNRRKRYEDQKHIHWSSQR